ncbi:phosphodiester glycosidase family protein [Actinocorallia aurea]
MRTFALVTALALSVQPGAAWAAPTPVDIPTYQTVEQGEAVEAHRVDRVVAPGIVRTSFDSLGRTGWLRTHVLNADLADDSVRVGLVGGKVSEIKKLSKAADDDGAVAAVNGDYYDINETNAAIGPEVDLGEVRKGSSGPSTVAAVDEDGVARLADVLLEGTVSVGGTDFAVGDLNAASAPANGIGVYTDQWGPGLRTSVALSGAYTEVVVAEGAVTAVTAALTDTAVPEGGIIVVGRGSAAAALAAAAQPGAAAKLDFALKSDSPAKIQTALGSGSVLVRDGKAIDLPASTGNDALKPRTAIGWSAGGKRLLLVTVDGSANFSEGVSFDQMAVIMARLGAHEALMLDGGGSSDLVARIPGDTGTSVVNTPSDGYERSIPQGVGLFSAPGSGRLQGLDVRLGADRVFPGLTVDVAAKGHDETYSPVEAGRTSWSAGRIGRVRDGVLTAEKSGTGEVTARSKSVSGKAELRVLGELDHLAFDEPSLTMTAGGTAEVSLTGADDEGFDAPVAPRDVKLDYDDSVVSVEADGDGFTVKAKDTGDGKAATITATVQDEKVALPVSVGLKHSEVAAYDAGATPWTATTAKATASIKTDAAADRPDAAADNQALRLTYDFTGQTGTSAAYAVAKPAPVTLPEGTRKLGLWVYGDGQKHWLRATLRSNGTTNVPFTFAATVDWTGWKWVEGDLPAGYAAPITLTNLYVVETSNLNKTAGELRFDSLTALVGQAAEGGSEADADPFVLQRREIGRDRWKFAIMSDLHVTAAGGANSFAAVQARKALAQAVAAKPDFLVVNGDFVDTATEADFAFAEALLKETVPASIPVYWTPGNHESGATATGTLAAFTKATDRPTRQYFDHKGTRFLLFDTNLGGLRASEWAQVPALKEQLAAAKRDRSVRSVVVVFHHPLADPSGAASSQFADRLEAGLVQEWLADFREDAGKPVALFTGHAHTASAIRADGVLEVNTPSVGKTPYASTDKGGFFGWVLVGVDATPGRVEAGRPNPDTLTWLTARMNPVIDAAAIQAPQALAAGASARVSATGTTSAFGLTFPLAHPASATWSGDAGVAVVRNEREAKAAAKRKGVVAVLDLSSGELTGVRVGTATLTVTSGGVSASAAVTVTA